MKRTLIQPDLSAIPEAFHPLLAGAPVYDSSCSQAARVLYIDRDGGYYLKSAPKGTLQTEANMTTYFARKGLGAQVIDYRSEARDWLLTSRVPGEDCTHAAYLDDPIRLCDTIAEQLRALHELDASDCPAGNTLDAYRAAAERSFRTGNFDATHFPDSFGCASAEEAWNVVRRDGHLLKADTLIHGDYCLPNIMLQNWRFTGFIDVGAAGVSDRHIDLFWGIWSLHFNLKTDRYRARFLDAYGRDLAQEEMLRVVAAHEVFG